MERSASGQGSGAGWRTALLCLGVLASCGRPTVVSATAAPAAAPKVATKAPAAFVVYLEDQRTLVIPIGADDRSRVVHGLWLPAPGSAVRYGLLEEAPQDADALLLEVCVDDELECDVTEPIRMTFSGEPRLANDEGAPCSCVYVPGVSDDQTWDYEGEDIDDDSDQDGEACPVAEVGELVSSPRLVAVEGGTVHFEEARYTGGCASGMPAWVADSVAIDVSPAYVARPMTDPRPSTCGDVGAYGMDYDNEPESVARCAGDVEYPTLLSGQRARVAVDYAIENGISICCAAVEPLSAKTCPSAVDPCGALDARGQDSASDYWVATDGSYMLARGAEGFTVSDRRGGTVLDVDAPSDATVVGVHFVGDASAYLDAVRPAPTWRFVETGLAVEMDMLQSTVDYIKRAGELLAAEQFEDARSVALTGLRNEHEEAIAGFGTNHGERFALLRLLEHIAAASHHLHEAAIFHDRADMIRGMTDE